MPGITSITNWRTSSTHCICRKNYDAMLPEMKPVDRAAMLADAKHMLAVLEGIEKYVPECEWLRALIREYEGLV